MRFTLPVRLERFKARCVLTNWRGFEDYLSGYLRCTYEFFRASIRLLPPSLSHFFRSFRCVCEKRRRLNVSLEDRSILRLKRLVLAMASCLSSHPFTRGESYVLANAIPSHEEGHRSQMIHNVRHLNYGAGGKKASWQDRCKFLGN